VLTEAAINGKVDHLRGLKENSSWPPDSAGTGMDYYPRQDRARMSRRDVAEQEAARWMPSPVTTKKPRAVQRRLSEKETPVEDSLAE